MGKFNVYRSRVKEGAWNDVIEAVWERYKAGGRESIEDAFTTEIEERIIARYEAKIRHAFQRAGVEVGEGEVIDKAWLCSHIGNLLGDVEVEDITPEAIMTAVDKSLSERLSVVLGMKVSTVMDMEQLKDDVREGVQQAIADGRAADLIFEGTMKAARRFATWKRNGGEFTKRAVQNHAAQRRYRQSHVMVWQ